MAYIGERWSGGAVIELTSLYVAGTILGGFAGRFLTGLLTEEWIGASPSGSSPG